MGVLRSDEEAFKQSVESITGPISRTISSKGMPAVYEALDAQGKETFKQVTTWSKCRWTCRSGHVKVECTLKARYLMEELTGCRAGC